MQKWMKENKVILISVIIVIALMIIFRQELLGNLVKYLAYPILIFACFFLIKNPLIKLIQHGIIIKTKHGSLEVGIKEGVKSFLKEEGERKHIDFLFKDDEVNDDNYNALIFLLGLFQLHLYINNRDYKLIIMADKCISYLQEHNYNTEHIEQLISIKQSMLDDK